MSDSPHDQPVRKPRWGRRLTIAVLVALVIVAVTIVIAGFTPLLDGDLTSHSDPAVSHDQAVALATALTEADGSDVNPDCRSIVIDSGKKEARSVVLLHGFTSCPAQFTSVARA